MCSYPLWREQVSGAGEQCNILERPKGKQHGGFLPLLSSINLLAFFSAFAACWLPRALTARQTSKYSISIAVQQLKNSIAGEGGSYSSPSHLWCRGVYLSLSSPQALNVHHGQGFCSSQAQILAVAKYVTDGSSEKQLLEVLACYFTSKRYEGSYQKKKMLAEMCRRTHENHKGRNSADEVTISCIDPSAMTDGLFVGSAESLNYLLSKMWQAHFLFVCFIPFIAELWDAFCFVSPPCKIRVRPTLGWLYRPNESYKHINGSSGASKSLLVSVLGTGDYSA